MVCLIPDLGPEILPGCTVCRSETKVTNDFIPAELDSGQHSFLSAFDYLPLILLPPPQFFTSFKITAVVAPYVWFYFLWFQLTKANCGSKILNEKSQK